MILVDTNIFLEILLEQESKEKCKAFLNEFAGELCITDFTLHSNCVILFKLKKQKVFTSFLQDIFPHVSLISLSQESYQFLEKTSIEYGLDFDDIYQFAVADENDFEIATQDKDFKKVEAKIKVRFI